MYISKHPLIHCPLILARLSQHRVYGTLPQNRCAKYSLVYIQRQCQVVQANNKILDDHVRKATKFLIWCSTGPQRVRSLVPCECSWMNISPCNQHSRLTLMELARCTYCHKPSYSNICHIILTPETNTADTYSRCSGCSR